MDFLSTSNGLRQTYRQAGFDKITADRLARGQTLIAKVENSTTIDEMRDVMRDLIRDLYELGHPVPPLQTADAHADDIEAAKSRR